MRRSVALGRIASAAIIVFGLAACGKPHDRDGLWKIVDGQCARDAGHAPCTVYDPARGYALLKDRKGRGQYLLIPTQHVAGVESPFLLRPQTPDYFAQAWAERGRVALGYGFKIPDDDLSLAINSAYGRSQDQLHIHIDCMTRYAHEELRKNWIGPEWSFVSLMGHLYRARHVASLDPSPFLLLHAVDMSVHTVFVTVAPGGGFIVLDDVARGLDRASGEELQDHECRIAAPSHGDPAPDAHASGMNAVETPGRPSAP